MRSGVTRSECVQALREVGLERGGTVMVHSSQRKIGQIEGISREDMPVFLKAILEIFDEVLDLEHAGTLVVPTYFYRYGHAKDRRFGDKRRRSADDIKGFRQQYQIIDSTS